MKIQWSPLAISDLKSIREYIAHDSPAAASKVAKIIQDAINHLSNFPFLGRPGRVFETRELVIPGTSYLAAYTIQEEEVLIATVMHGRQDWPESFQK